MADDPNPFNAPAAANANATEEPPKKKGIVSWSDVGAARALRLANILNGLVLIVLAVVVFIVGLVQVAFSTVVVSVYIIVFGLMLICVELNIANLQPRLKAQVGFLFTYKGRALFILFAATMAVSMGSDWVGYLGGAVTAANAIFNILVVCIHPAWKAGGRFHKGDITLGYSTAEDAAETYIRENPDMALRAGRAVGSAVAQNPDLARKAAVGAAQGVVDNDKRR